MKLLTIGLNLERRKNMIIKVQYNRDITCDEIFGVLENIEIQDCNLYHINFPVMILRMVTP